MSKPFKMRSGNSPLFKNMGSSPAKHTGEAKHPTPSMRAHKGHESRLVIEKLEKKPSGPPKTGSPAKQGMMAAGDPEKQMAQAGVNPQDIITPMMKTSPVKQGGHEFTHKDMSDEDKAKFEQLQKDLKDAANEGAEEAIIEMIQTKLDNIKKKYITTGTAEGLAEAATPKMGSPAKNYKNPQDYKVFNYGNKPTPVAKKKKKY